MNVHTYLVLVGLHKQGAHGFNHSPTSPVLEKVHKTVKHFSMYLENIISASMVAKYHGSKTKVWILGADSRTTLHNTSFLLSLYWGK